jgi:lysophospholipase
VREWRADDGWTIRTMHWERAGHGPGSILFAGGRADFIEKYCESLWDWRERGFAVATFDWRGQGLSGRLGDHPQKGHAADFERWVQDFAGLADWFTSTLPAPHYLVAHSMGAHLALRHLAGGGRPFARVVLLAPMIGLGLRPLPKWLIRMLVRRAIRRGRAQDWAVSQGPRRQPGPRRRGLLTSDPDRYEDEGWWLNKLPALTVGGVTYGWLAGALESMAALDRPGALEAVETPILVLMPEHDRLVDPSAAARAAGRLGNARFEMVDGAKHELLRETDAIRSAVQSRLIGFLLGEHRSQARPGAAPEGGG